MNPILSVFTPTYNRAHTLHRVYESLRGQDCDGFEWVVVDDGSTDSTRDLVELWVKEATFPIKYVYQRNKGMVAAHNTAFDHISGEIHTCIDSDDFLVPGAVKVILEKYSAVRGMAEIGGIVGLDVAPDGSVIGERFPDGLEVTTFTEIRFKHKVRGDKKYVFRTAVINEAGRYPDVPGEKFPAVSYLYRVIDRQYKLSVMNVPLCVVEYQPEGNSRQKFNQYKTSPNAFMKFRELCMDAPYNRREKFVSAIHYVASALFAGKVRLIATNGHRLYTMLAFPAGASLYLYLRSTSRTGVIK